MRGRLSCFVFPRKKSPRWNFLRINPCGREEAGWGRARGQLWCRPGSFSWPHTLSGAQKAVIFIIKSKQMITMWLKVITCILDSNEFRWGWVQCSRDVTKGPVSCCLSVLPSAHSAPCSGSIQRSLQFLTFMTKKEGCGHTPHILPPKNSSGKEIKSLVTPVKSKRLL